MSLTDARAWVRDYARNAGDFVQYPPARLDRAIQYIGTEYVRLTRCTRNTSTVAITGGSASISASVTGFRPEYLIGDPRAWVTVSGAFTAAVEVVAESDVYREQLHNPQTTAPRSDRSKLAFLSNSSGTVLATIYPTPDAAATYVLNLMWSPPFQVWSPGTTPGDGVTFNLPDEDMIPLLTLYVPRALQHNEPEHIYAADRDEEFKAYCRSRAGSGNLGDNSVTRESTRRWRL